jgi:hypothetical protein
MTATAQHISHFDDRPFFEKVLVFGLNNGTISPEKLESIGAEAPKGIVQIARYFGSEFLRPELELARDRLVNLVGLHLAHASQGELQRAAELLRDNSLLSRSKAGSDMLKALIVMPQSTHFGMNERRDFRDEHIPLLAKWSLQSLTAYQAEIARRSRAKVTVDAAIWMAERMGLDAETLEEAGKDAEAVIRSALLTLACKRSELPDWLQFEKMILALRKRYQTKPGKLPLTIPPEMPPDWKALVESIQDSVWEDAPKWLESSVAPRKLFDHTPSLIGRYFWLEDPIAEVEQFEKNVSRVWAKFAGESEDESSLLTAFTCLAAGSAPHTILTEKSMLTLVKKIRKNGWQPELATHFIQAHAPSEHAADYVSLWQNFVEDAEPTLTSDHEYTLNDALALLRREINIRA